MLSDGEQEELGRLCRSWAFPPARRRTRNRRRRRGPALPPTVGNSIRRSCEIVAHATVWGGRPDGRPPTQWRSAYIPL